ncbi:hypothetical protein [Cribrihabitans pelagius]|uniref:hypothetical protein n=1 Tax=Cribrihabitans pelagius TaxID=1765746 RepID=UPI003B58DE2F
METTHTEKHKLRDAETELFGGELDPPREGQSRAEYIPDRVNAEGLSHVSEPADFGLEPKHTIHRTEFVSFLRAAWPEWTAEGFKGEAILSALPARRMTQKMPPHY